MKPLEISLGGRLEDWKEKQKDLILASFTKPSAIGKASFTQPPAGRPTGPLGLGAGGGKAD